MRIQRFSCLIALLAVACDLGSPLTVRDPDVVPQSSTINKASLPTLRVGALALFQIAIGGGADLTNGGHEGQIGMTSIFTDEQVAAETFPTRITVNVDIATPSNLNLDSLFLNLASARFAAELTARRYGQFDPQNGGRAEMLDLAGYTYLNFAENYCASVPFSTLSDAGTVEFGAPLTTAQMLDTAMVRFDAAAALIASRSTGNATEDSSLVNLARVGRARADQDLGNFAQAVTDLAAVPAGFEYDIRHSTNTLQQENGIYNYAYVQTSWVVADGKGGTGLHFVSANDPRVPFIKTTMTTQGGQPNAILETKYPSGASPIPLATSLEASLIRAEALLFAGSGAWVDTLSALRATVGLGPIAAGTSLHDNALILYSERAFWLWGTGHRLGDWRRLVTRYPVAVAEVYSTAPGYGTAKEFPVPVDEYNNPRFHPGSCDVTQP